MAWVGFGKVGREIIEKFGDDICVVRDLSKVEKDNYKCRFTDNYGNISDCALYIISVSDSSVCEVVKSLSDNMSSDRIVLWQS